MYASFPVQNATTASAAAPPIWPQKINYYLSIDPEKFPVISYPKEDAKSFICYCFDNPHRPLSVDTFRFLQTKVNSLVIGDFIKVKEFQYFIQYIDAWRIMIQQMGPFYYEKSNGKFLLSDLSVSSIEAKQLLFLKKSQKNDFVLRGSQSQIGYLAVTFVEESEPTGKLTDVLLRFRLDIPGYGWDIQVDKGKNDGWSDIYPTVKELIQKCKVFSVFCLPDCDNFPKDQMLLDA